MNTFKKILFSVFSIIALGVGGAYATRSIIVGAVPVPVPAAPGNGYILTSTTTGAYIASSTATITAGNFNATSTRSSSLPYASTTALSVSSSFAVTPLTSALTLTGTDGTFAEYTGTSCTNQFVRSVDALGVATCATVTSGDVSLANLTATDTTLTFSGTYNGSTARTIGLNLGNANTWTGLQTFSYASSTALTASDSASTTRLWISGLGTPAGSFLAVDFEGKVIATTSPSGGGGSGTVGSGTLDQLAFYSSAGTSVEGVDGWRLLASSTCTSQCTSTTTATFSGETNLRIIVRTTGMNSASATQCLRFNGDTGDNYAFDQVVNGVDVSIGVPQSGRLCFADWGTATTSPQYGVFEVRNDVSRQKKFRGEFGSYPLGASQPTNIEVSGVWNNLTSAITSVTLIDTDGPQFLAGSSIEVWGSSN